LTELVLSRALNLILGLVHNRLLNGRIDMILQFQYFAVMKATDQCVDIGDLDMFDA